MASRSGQSGYIERKGNAWHVRFRIDVPGQEKRAYKSIRLCPVSGPGKLTKPERERMAKEVIAASGADTVEHFEKVVSINEGETFRVQAYSWLTQIQHRKRKPNKSSTIHNWRCLLEKWVLPELGDLNMVDVNNAALKRLVEKLYAASLSPRSIKNICQIPKMVMASAINDEGEELHPRKWNTEFLDMPTVDNQHQPTFTSAVVSQVVAMARGQFRMLYALLAATGMRAGEVLALEIEKHVSSDCRVLSIRQSVWGNQVQSPKTRNAIREIDLPSNLAAMLKSFIGDRKSGLLFRNGKGKFLHQTNVLRRSLHPMLKKLNAEIAGMHAFRRFRATHLRKARAPEDLIRLWLGHANQSITDGYSKLREDVEFRKECVESIGLGFELPSENGEVAPKLLACTQTVSECVVV